MFLEKGEQERVRERKYIGKKRKEHVKAKLVCFIAAHRHLIRNNERNQKEKQMCKTNKVQNFNSQQ